MNRSIGGDGVAVVVTTYNDADYLAEAIESVLAQTHPVAEIVVVDDGSAVDPSPVTRAFPQVRLIRQANQGLSGARNTGWRAVSQPYVLFLDADDRLRPRMVECTLERLGAEPDSAFAYGAYAFIDREGHVTKEMTLTPPGEDPYASFLATNIVGMHATVLYRRSILEDMGGFDTRLPNCEDYDLYLRITRSHGVSASPEILAEYRRHSQNMSNDMPRMMEGALAVLERQRETAASRPEWRRALEFGLSDCKRHYGALQFARMRQALRSRRDILEQLAKTAAIARSAPAETRGLIAHAVRRRMKRLARARDLKRPVRFGDLDRTTPFSDWFGYDRGTPMDRGYIDDFLHRHRSDIKGRVLEIGDNEYTLKHGGSAVVTSDVLNRYEGGATTTIVADLSEGDAIPSEAFDCIVLTQTLHLIFDMPVAVATLHRILKPGGVLLVTVPWASPIDRGEWGSTWYWSISPSALLRLLAGPFAREAVSIESLGNVKVAAAFLYGLAEHEIPAADRAVSDPCCPVIVTGRAVKGPVPA